MSLVMQLAFLLMIFADPQLLSAQAPTAGQQDSMQQPAEQKENLRFDEFTDAAPDTASEEEIDPVFFRDVAYELRCPTCTGLSVLESSASFSEQIKSQVREQISAGKDKGEILEFFVERYGPWILREPPKEGFNLLAWLLPTAVLVFGPIVIWLLVWKRRREVETYGVRSLESVIDEMNSRLNQMRNQ